MSLLDLLALLGSLSDDDKMVGGNSGDCSRD